MNIEKLAEKLGVDVPKARSITFWVVDHLLDNISQKAIDCGAYTNSPMNGDKNMVESFRAILWAQYEELNGDIPEQPGPWVTVDPLGIQVHKERPRYG